MKSWHNGIQRHNGYQRLQVMTSLSSVQFLSASFRLAQLEHVVKSMASLRAEFGERLGPKKAVYQSHHVSSCLTCHITVLELSEVMLCLRSHVFFRVLTASYCSKLRSNRSTSTAESHQESRVIKNH